jgi:hypothetical protein
MKTAVAEVHARRVTGGAIVRVLRDGQERRYRVTLRRYNRLLDTLNVHHHLAGGCFLRHGFEVRVADVAGLRDAREWARTHGNPRGKHWRRS